MVKPLATSSTASGARTAFQRRAVKWGTRSDVGTAARPPFSVGWPDPLSDQPWRRYERRRGDSTEALAARSPASMDVNLSRAEIFGRFSRAAGGVSVDDQRSMKARSGPELPQHAVPRRR